MLADMEVLLNEKTYRYIVINKVTKTRQQMNHNGACTLMHLLGITNPTRSFPTLKNIDEYVKTQFEGA